MGIRLALFDLLGTLIDEEADFEALDQVMERVAERFDVPVPPSELSGAFTLAFMEIVRSESSDDDEPADFIPFSEAARDIFAGLMAHYGISTDPADLDWFWETYQDIQRDTWRPYDDVIPTLRTLQEAGILIGVVTDADRYLVEDALPAAGLDDLIDIRVSAEECGHVKPHGAVFRLALERARTKASETVMIGDSYERDVLGALGAGIPHAVLLDRHDARTVRGPRITTLETLSRQLGRLEV